MGLMISIRASGSVADRLADVQGLIHRDPETAGDGQDRNGRAELHV